MKNEPKGKFFESLTRKNSKIKEDRAEQIYRNAEKAFRRKIEDLKDSIEAMEDERESLLDLSPTNTQSLILASDFKADDFYATEERLARDIHNKTILHEKMLERYNALFGSVEEPEAVN